jgi:hypothetical protein
MRRAAPPTPTVRSVMTASTNTSAYIPANHTAAPAATCPADTPERALTSASTSVSDALAPAHITAATAYGRCIETEPIPTA